MFFGSKKEEMPTYDKVETLIGSGTVFEGNIVAEGTIRIDGKLKGEIKSQGDLVIGENGIIQGNISVRNVLVAGEVTGDILAEEKMEITSTGKIFGNLNVKNLLIDEGAVFEGHCTMEAIVENHNNEISSDSAEPDYV